MAAKTDTVNKSADTANKNTDPVYEIGEWIKFDPGNGQERPAMVTDIADGKVWLMVIHKGHFDFVGQILNKDAEAAADDKSTAPRKVPDPTKPLDTTETSDNAKTTADKKAADKVAAADKTKADADKTKADVAADQRPNIRE